MSTMGTYFIVSRYLVVLLMYFHYRKIVGGEIINIPIASSVVLKGFYFLQCQVMTSVGNNTR